MIKKQKEKQNILDKSPYMYYVTNWGFVEQPTQQTNNNKSKSDR